ncbi:hypothetical protein NMA510612_0581 [Neisseria meningitidis]|uniref:Uncharacterized protein n=1 Tax=Neisseria meningitidis TaxID=487 RepID=X5EN65_NEIME|nr:hypothetical protein NMA510612_0581 [Neisseria meningitidis]
MTIHTYPWYEWFFCTLKMPSERSDGIFMRQVSDICRSRL